MKCRVIRPLLRRMSQLAFHSSNKQRLQPQRPKRPPARKRNHKLSSSALPNSAPTPMVMLGQQTIKDQAILTFSNRGASTDRTIGRTDIISFSHPGLVLSRSYTRSQLKIFVRVHQTLSSFCARHTSHHQKLQTAK